MGRFLGDNYNEEEYPPNVSVKQLPGFDITFADAYRAFERSGTALLPSHRLYTSTWYEHYF
jgi:hypothetical protein